MQLTVLSIVLLLTCGSYWLLDILWKVQIELTEFQQAQKWIQNQQNGQNDTWEWHAERYE